MVNMNFQNNQIDINDLPTIEEIVFEKLHPNYKKISVYITGIVFTILLSVYFAIGLFVEEILLFPIVLMVMIGWSIVTGLSIILSIKGYEYQGYALREKDVLYKNGIFFKSTVIVPFNRIQHCEIEQGPIDRQFDLAELSLFTAGGSSSDVSIPGLTLDKANALKNFITNRTAKDEEE